MRIPLFATSHAQHAEELIQRIGEVVASGRYILGPEVRAFEQEFAQYIGSEHCVGVGNGTDALTIALKCLDLPSDSEVILPSFTFYATAEAVINAGATPAFCDIDLDTFCITPQTVEAALTPKSAAIVAVDLFGNVAPIPDLRRFGLPIVEDAAQAAGAALSTVKAGALGDVAAFSFFPSKNLFCLGDGGAVVTGDGGIAESARLLRHHGTVDKQTHSAVGYNSRLDAIQAAVLRELLPHLEAWTVARREVASMYESEGIERFVSGPAVPAGVEHAFHLYCARHPEPDRLAAALNEQGVQARGYYRVPVHRQAPMRKYLTEHSPRLAATDEAAQTNIALPMGPQLSHQEVADVVRACSQALAL